MKSTQSLAWSDETIAAHVKDFPIATAHDIIDRLFVELELNGGFDALREERIRILQEGINKLVQRIDEMRGSPAILPEPTRRFLKAVTDDIEKKGIVVINPGSDYAALLEACFSQTK